MTPEKLRIFIETNAGPSGPDEKTTEAIQVRFNPNQLNLEKVVSWCKVKVAGGSSLEAAFTYGNPLTLSMDLFFDSYEKHEDVRKDTKKVEQLAKVDGNLGRPPRCQLQWGNFDFDGIWWVVTRLSQRFTLFLDNGFPARATLSCSFQQWRSGEDEKKETRPSSADVVKIHVVRRGETLSSIAAEEYGDPGLWRPVAEANSIDNPRNLKPGEVLHIPPLKPGRSAG